METGNILNNSSKITIRNKGKSLLEFPNDYVLLDLETTGYYPSSEIIEFGLLKVVNNQVTEIKHSLIKPPQKIPKNITNLTGISNEDVVNAPLLQSYIPEVLSFIDNNIVIAHNAHFDINFLYDATFKHLNSEFKNDFVDTLRISRRLFPRFPKHSLEYLALNIPLENKNGHRALTDCQATFDLVNVLKTKIESEGITFEPKPKRKLLKPTDIKPLDDSIFDEESPFYMEECVFTGTLESMVRNQAIQHVKNIGGDVKNTITKKTKFLIMGLQDYSKFADGKESSKTKKAKEYASEGQNIHIISEHDFLKIINNVE